MQGQVFACTTKTKSECFERLLFSTNRTYAPAAMRVKKDHFLFLLDLDNDLLYGVFKASSDAKMNIQPNAWKGKYPYQVEVRALGKIVPVKNAKNLLKKLGISRSSPINRTSLIKLLEIYRLESYSLENWFEYLSKEDGSRKVQICDETKSWQLFSDLKKLKIKPEEELPLLEATTLWDFPRQSYGITPKGDNKYPGVTPALLIWNLIWKYTDPGDLVVDPMCGSGTTIDVCKEEGRRVIGYDIHPVREDIIENDARNIPLSDNTVDLVFIDSPYGDNIRYNENPASIGKISSEKDIFYDELEKVIKESYRILKPGKTLGWLIGDQWVKKKFTPVGFNLFERLTKYFETRDIICITRRGQSSNTGLWHNRARRFNFFLRGFKYLFIMRKPLDNIQKPEKPRKIKWNHYKR
jgi:DNA modification methylase